MRNQYFAEKLPCNACGELILPSTAEKTGGLCMPCKSGYRKSIEFARLRWEEEKQLLATPVGQHWNELSIQVHELPESFFTLSAANQALFAVGTLKTNVSCGGFHQYFFRHAADHFLIAVCGLMEMGATRSLSLVMRCKKLYFGTRPMPCSLDLRRSFIANSDLLGDQSQELTMLEHQFRNEHAELIGRMSKFADKHGLLDVCDDRA